MGKSPVVVQPGPAKSAATHYSLPFSKTDASLRSGHLVVTHVPVYAAYCKPTSKKVLHALWKARPRQKKVGVTWLSLATLARCWISLTRSEQEERRSALRSSPLSEAIASVIAIDVASDDPKAWE